MPLFSCSGVPGFVRENFSADARDPVILSVHAVYPASRKFLKCALGYPRGISRNKPGRGNNSMCSQRKLIPRLATTLENAGIAAFAVCDALVSVDVRGMHISSKHCPPFMARGRKRWA